MQLYTPVLATEIEFYLHGAHALFSPEQVVEHIRDICAKAGIALYSAGQEKGRDQYEVALQKTSDIITLAADTERFKAVLADAFAPHGITADFRAKPVLSEPGSGLHVHIHFEDKSGKNIFFRTEEGFSPELLYAIGGLLAHMQADMSIFAPFKESYARFTHKSNAPTTVSWGTNNRTTAIRLPNKPMEDKHIEHRVAGSDAVVIDVIHAIIQGSLYGIARKCDPGEPIYGDASLPQYKLSLLPGSLEEARNVDKLITY